MQRRYRVFPARHRHRGPLWVPPSAQAAPPAPVPALTRQHRKTRLQPHRRHGHLYQVPPTAASLPVVVFTAGAARSRWKAGGLSTYTQSVLSTQYIQIPITVEAPEPYDPVNDAVAFAFPPLTYPPTTPTTWYTGSWSTFPGPQYRAQCLVGPSNGGVLLAVGSYSIVVKISDDPELPVLYASELEITP